VLAQALRVAPGLTSGQLRARLATLTHRADPDLARRRYRQGLSERRLNHGRCGQGTGCRVPARACDIDHTIRHRHGRLEWTTPLGQT
jgi:hypothetical protein